MRYIPYGTQSIDDDDVAAVVDILKSKFLTQGPKVPEFEAAVSKYCGSNYAVAVNSATSALHIACLALGVGRGDVVWTSPITFVATSNAALLCGATVDFVDIDSKTFNMSCDDLERKLEAADKIGGLPKVVIPVHMAGQSCNMEKISRLSKQYNFSVIEDASHAVGAEYKSEKVGGCQFSDITIFSFHPVKIITTGEGGMALTNRKELADSMYLLRSHGVTRDTDQMSAKISAPEPWYYEQIALGLNYRMTDLEAGLGLSQLTRLDLFIEKRRTIAARYKELLSSMPITLPYEHIDSQSSYHLYIVRFEPNVAGKRKQVFDSMREAGIGVNVHYIPVYKQPYYKSLGYDSAYCQNAEHYYASCITLPIYPTLSIEEQNYVVQALSRAIDQ